MYVGCERGVLAVPEKKASFSDWVRRSDEVMVKHLTVGGQWELVEEELEGKLRGRLRPG